MERVTVLDFRDSYGISVLNSHRIVEILDKEGPQGMHNFRINEEKHGITKKIYEEFCKATPNAVSIKATYYINDNHFYYLRKVRNTFVITRKLGNHIQGGNSNAKIVLKEDELGHLSYYINKRTSLEFDEEANHLFSIVVDYYERLLGGQGFGL